MIRVAFRYNDKRLFSRLVSLVQGGDSAHCEVAYYWEGLTHQCVSSSFVDGGLRKKEIHMLETKWRIYEVSDNTKDEVLSYYENHKGSKYDWLGLLGFIIRRVKGFSKRKFCSEVAAEVLDLKDPWRYDLALLESVCIKIGKRVQ